MLIIDTAGRLQNKSNLMDELGKIRRVTEKNLPVDEVLLVLDATTGQNGMAQAKVFAEAIGITGVVLSVDGSAKGGIVISVQKELGVPVESSSVLAKVRTIWHLSIPKVSWTAFSRRRSSFSSVSLCSTAPLSEGSPASVHVVGAGNARNAPS